MKRFHAVAIYVKARSSLSKNSVIIAEFATKRAAENAARVLNAVHEALLTGKD